MGSLAGHVIPGIFFILYGYMWSFNFLVYHIRTRATQKSSSDPRSRKDRSASSSFFEFKRDQDLSKRSWIPFPCTRFPLEPIGKVLFPAVGMMVEAFLDYKTDEEGNRHLIVTVYSPWNADGSLNGMSKLHHITMYGSFMLSGIIDLTILCVKLPKQTSMLFLTVAFVVEGLLFYLHTMGRDLLNVELHSLLFYAIFACVVFSFLRVFSATNLLINLGLGSSMLLQGTWFVQAGYILFGGFMNNHPLELSKGSQGEYSPEDSDDDSHKYIMFVVACFTWHLVLVALSNVLTWVFLSICLRTRLLHRRNPKRRAGLLTSLRQGWKGGALEEQSRLIVEEENQAGENEIEMKHVTETHT